MASQYLYNIKGRYPTGNNRSIFITKISVSCHLNNPFCFIQYTRFIILYTNSKDKKKRNIKKYINLKS
jgi:hypothetical protein